VVENLSMSLGEPFDVTQSTALQPHAPSHPTASVQEKPHRKERFDAIAVPVLTGFASLLIALSVMPSGPGRGDSAELTMALALGGIPHPTGYPLYILLGWPFVRVAHAFGFSWPAAANLWSGVAAAVAIALYTRLGMELIRRLVPHDVSGAMAVRRWSAVFPSMLLALHPVWLIAATQAEVHAFWYALTAGAALFALREIDRWSAPSMVPPEAMRPWLDSDARAAGWWGVLCGASLAHHVTSIWILLPLTLMLASAANKAGRMHARLVVAAACGALIALSSYGFIVWRTFHLPAYQWPIDPSWAGIVRHLTGSMYARYLGGFAPNADQLALIRGAVLPFLTLVPLAGLWAVRTPVRAISRWLRAMLAGVALLGGFVMMYGVPDPAAYFVPALMLGNLLALPMIAWLARRGRAPLAGVVLTAALITVASWSLMGAMIERNRLAAADRSIRAAWRNIPFDEGIVVWLGDRSARLEILRTLERQRPGLYVVNPNLLTWPISRARFERRFGVDPIEGWTYQNYWAELPAHLCERSGLPVIDFGEFLEDRAARMRSRISR
jgi:hypothetical protein